MDTRLGTAEGNEVGTKVGDSVGTRVGDSGGSLVEDRVGNNVGVIEVVSSGELVHGAAVTIVGLELG